MIPSVLHLLMTDESLRPVANTAQFNVCRAKTEIPRHSSGAKQTPRLRPQLLFSEQPALPRSGSLPVLSEELPPDG